jgi:hypothetical protein
MQYRSWLNTDPAKPFSVSGYQADFDGSHAYSGILYGEGYRDILCMRGQVSIIGDDSKPKEVASFGAHDDFKKVLKVEDWNSYEVIAEGLLLSTRSMVMSSASALITIGQIVGKAVFLLCKPTWVRR